MERSFGMDTKPTSNSWAVISRGPTRGEVRAHIAKLAAMAKAHKR